MGLAPEDRYAFSVEWLDPSSGVLWRYQLLHQPSSREIEMFDAKRRTFLKKTRYEALPTEQLRPGNTVVVYGRQLKVLDYADAFTRTQLEQQQQRTCIVVKPYAVELLGDILSALHEAGFLLQGAHMLRITSGQARSAWQHLGPKLADQLAAELARDPIVVLDLVAEGAFQRWRAFCEQLGQGGVAEACIGAENAGIAAHQLEALCALDKATLCFSGEQTSLCLIKPHAIVQGDVGPIIKTLSQHFAITGMRSAALEAKDAQHFYEVYKGVVPGGQLSASIQELIAGPCLAVEVASAEPQHTDTVEDLRALCGPAEPEMARDLRPHTLRALYGLSQAQNAVHCTDLEEDAPLETAFFFTLQ